MKTVAEFVKTTVAGGFFVVLPVLLLIMVFSELVDILVEVSKPAAPDLSVDEPGGRLIITLIGVSEAILICFVTGLLVRTRWGGSARKWVETRILERLPGYTTIKNLTQRFAGAEGTQFAPAEIDLYGSDTRVLGLIVEELPDRRFAVFVPVAPTATIGQVHLVPHERVRQLEASLGATVNSLSQWGLGTGKLFQTEGGPGGTVETRL